MLNVIITLMTESHEVTASRNVQIINGVGQARDMMEDSMYTWIYNQAIVKFTHEEYEGNPILYIEMDNGEIFVIGANMTEAEEV